MITPQTKLSELQKSLSQFNEQQLKDRFVRSLQQTLRVEEYIVLE